MAFGLDYVSGPPIAAMLAAKVAFVCRYTGYFSGYDIAHPEKPQGKCLWPGEATALNKAGIAVVSNWEWSANRAVQGRSAGEWDADKADKIHRACGGESSRPIYFSVDVNVPGQEVLAYFQGVASVLGLHRTGAYGSYAVLHELFNVGAITWGWQTYAWSGGMWEPRAHIRQYHNSVNLAGASVDYNRSMQADFGQWGIERTDMAISPNDPIIDKYFTYNPTAGTLTRKDTGVVLGRGVTSFYLKYGGPALLRLPISGEIQAVDAQGQPIAGVSYVIMESCVIVYDPQRKIDHPPINEECYLLHIDKGPGQTVVANPLVAPLNSQIAQLKALLSAEQQKVAPPDPILQQKIDNFKTLSGQMQALAATL